MLLSMNRNVSSSTRNAHTGIGSKGTSCFEEYVHSQAPHCIISTFDPTISAISKQLFAQCLPWVRLHLVGLYHESAFNGLNFTSHGKRKVLRGEVRPLMSLIDDFTPGWIDYLKIDCEGCEFDAIPQFLEQSTARLGRVPVTQINIEVHVPLPGMEGYSARQASALKLLTKLKESGFVPFHIDVDGRSCSTEYSLFNTRVPRKHWLAAHHSSPQIRSPRHQLDALPSFPNGTCFGLACMKKQFGTPRRYEKPFATREAAQKCARLEVCARNRGSACLSG